MDTLSPAEIETVRQRTLRWMEAEHVQLTYVARLTHVHYSSVAKFLAGDRQSRRVAIDLVRHIPALGLRYVPARFEVVE